MKKKYYIEIAIITGYYFGMDFGIPQIKSEKHFTLKFNSTFSIEKATKFNYLQAHFYCDLLNLASKKILKYRVVEIKFFKTPILQDEQERN